MLNRSTLLVQEYFYQTTAVRWNTAGTSYGDTHPVDLELRGRQRQARFSATRIKSQSHIHALHYMHA